jgi:hypothetical protein
LGEAKQFHPCKQLASAATRQFNAIQKRAHNLIGRTTNDHLIVWHEDYSIKAKE